jgi:hypothetical protein
MFGSKNSRSASNLPKKRWQQIKKVIQDEIPGKLMCRNDKGVLVPLRPKGSTWYAIYVKSPQLDNKKFHQKIRKHFRTPYSHFLELVRMVKESDLFKRWLSFGWLCGFDRCDTCWDGKVQLPCRQYQHGVEAEYAFPNVQYDG